MPARKSSTFIQQARRGQLLEVAVEVLATDGGAGASVSAVARRAGVSRGVVTYHFADLDDLLRHVVAHVYALGEQHVGAEVDAASSGLERVLAFVRGSVAFYAARPREMRALHVIYAVGRLASRAEQPEHQREVDDLRHEVEQGIADRSIREADAPLVVAAIRGALDHAYARTADGADPEAVAAATVRLAEDLLAPR